MPLIKLIKIINKISKMLFGDIFSGVYMKIIMRIQSARFSTVNKLNIGCGSNHVKGWLNLCIFPVMQYPEGILVEESDGRSFLNADINLIDFDLFGKIQYSYASHFIEHLTFSEASIFLKKLFVSLESGGVVRFTCPDMELWIKNYYEDNREFFSKYKSYFLEDTIFNTKGNIFMAQVNSFGHKWNYDFESISQLLYDVGFTDVSKRILHDSAIPNIGELESDEDRRVFETLFVEAVKP
jgi:predicted SAM-dependent methyltransferase